MSVKYPGITDKSVTVERLIEGGYETVNIPLPCLLSVVNEISHPRLPTLRGKQAARAKQIPLHGIVELDIEASNVGLKGSPTRVVKIMSPKVTRSGVLIDVKKTGGKESGGRSR